HRHLTREVELLRPRLVIPVGKLAIAQLFPDVDQLVHIIGQRRRAELAGVAFDAIALPHPSGASTWHRMEPGQTLLTQAPAEIAAHAAWRSLLGPATLQPDGQPDGQPDVQPERPRNGRAGG